MNKTASNLTLLTIIFVVSLLTSNVVTGKLVATGIYINNWQIVVPGAVFCYGLTFLTTDVIGELWGKKQADQCVKFGFIAQLIALILIQLTRILPTYSDDMQAAFNMVLGQGWIYVLGSLCAYYCAQSWDVFIFHKIRDLFKRNPKHRWIWNNLSTITSQFIDTIIFIVIAFGFGLGWIFNNLEMLWLIIIGQYVVKTIIAILDTPFFYLLTRRKHED